MCLVQAAADFLKNERIDMVFSSPLSRALYGAERIAANYGLTPIQDDRFREINRVERALQQDYALAGRGAPHPYRHAWRDCRLCAWQRARRRLRVVMYDNRLVLSFMSTG